MVVGEPQLATFAGGCFWCMEPPFEKIDGVSAVISGYSGGRTEDPNSGRNQTPCRSSVRCEDGVPEVLH